MHARSYLVAIALLAAATAASAQNGVLDALKKELGNAGTGTANANAAGGAIASGGMGVAGAALAKGMGLSSMPEVGSGTMGNVAGVLQYCIKNNYLSADATVGVKDKLLGMVTGQKPQQTGFDNGAKGLLQGSNGHSFDLRKGAAQLKIKACDYVLDNAKKLI